MPRIQSGARLHLLTVKQVRAAGEGDHVDGGGLLPRNRGASSASVFRFTAASGRRRETGMGLARRGSAGRRERRGTITKRDRAYSDWQARSAVDRVA